MAEPKLTFFCELEVGPLMGLFDNPQVISDLQALGAGISLGLRDLSHARAGVVRRLNEAGVPVVAWLLLPEDQGYWLNLDNPAQALARYDRFMAWTAEHGLHWEAIGLDFEPDMRVLRQAFSGDWRMLVDIVRRAVDTGRFQRGRMFYRRLVARIRADGYRVDSYDIPLIVDERRVNSMWVQRLLGLVDLDVDHEVLMLYTSMLRPLGPGVLWSYAPEAQSIGVGSTGGGVTVGGVDQIPPLSWEEFARDLQMACGWSDDIHIFSLEGAVQQGFLTRLREFDWTQSPPVPWHFFKRVERLRWGLRTVLWLSAHPWVGIGGLAALLGMYTVCQLKKRSATPTSSKI